MKEQCFRRSRRRAAGAAGGRQFHLFICTWATSSKIKTSACTRDQYLYEGFLVFWSSGLLPLRQETSSPEVQQSTCRILVCC
jgi:hypothetical protein